jgi:putative chitobiose transport system permease protein
MNNNSARRRVTLSPYLLLLPAIVAMGLFTFYPMLSIFGLSTTNYNLASQRDNVGLANYERLLTLDWRLQEEGASVRQTIPSGYGVVSSIDLLGQRYILSARDPDFWHAMANSVLYLLVTPVIIILSIGLAVLVNQPLHAMGFFRAGFYLPAITSVIALGLMWRTLYQQNGLINQVLSLLGLQAVPWLSSPDTALLSAMIVTIWRGVGFYMVIFLAGLQSIPRELYEAAAIDGANRMRQHLNITLPGLLPSIVFVAVISSISALRAFEEIYVVAGEDGGVLNSGRTAVMYIYNQFDTRLIGYAAAASVIFFVVTLVFSLLNVRLLERRNV